MTPSSTEDETTVRKLFEKHTMSENDGAVDPELTLFDTDELIKDLEAYTANERRKAADEAAKWKDIADELAEAIRLTQEYVGEDTLPNIEDWSHFDAMQKYRVLKGNN